jgi:hypothetical protein
MKPTGYVPIFRAQKFPELSPCPGGPHGTVFRFVLLVLLLGMDVIVETVLDLTELSVG